MAKMNEAKFVIYFCYFSFYLYGAVYRAERERGGGLELRSPEVQSRYMLESLSVCFNTLVEEILNVSLNPVLPGEIQYSHTHSLKVQCCVFVSGN